MWKKIPEIEYIYAYEKDGKWIKFNSKYARAKLLLTKNFSKTNILISKAKTSKKTIEPLNVEPLNVEQANVEPVNVEKIVEELPPLLKINDDEKFKDADGIPLNIEIRGEREYDKIYFKGIDVEHEFLMPYLVKHIISKDTKYQEEIHYKNFRYNKKNNIYLTYEGLLKIIFNARDSRTKEKNIVNNIIKNTNVQWICNKPLKCSYRPDMLFMDDNNTIIIEIDEYQHKQYNKKDDEIRTQQINKEINKKNILILRINPDNYIDLKNVSHNGIVNNIDEFKLRMNIIIDTIKENINKKTDGLKTIYLFYDNYKLLPSKNNYDINYEINESYQKIESIRNNLIKKLFNNTLNTKIIIPISCIYLTTLGNVKELRNILGIDNKYSDDMIVVKYGILNDFCNGVKLNVNKTFESIENVNVMVKYYSYVDIDFMSKAELDMKKIFKLAKLNFIHEKYDELAIVSLNELDDIKKYYENIQTLYCGKASDYINKIQTIEKEHMTQIQMMEKDYEIQIIKKDNIIMEKEHQVKLMKKENENLILKNENLSLKLLMAQQNIK
jgi:hypothetical protein